MKGIIITSQRSGSNFLRHCLNSHPNVKCDGELLIGGAVDAPRMLEDWRLPTKIYRYMAVSAWRPVKILENFCARNEAPALLFKAMYNQLSNTKAREFLSRRTDIRVIHLRRENLLKQYVSKVLLGKRRERRWQPHSTNKVPAVSVRISPTAALKEMRRVCNQFAEFERLLSHHQKIELVYETMINGQSLSEETTEAICGLLHIEPAPMYCNFVKINPNKLELMVENYDELVKALRGTEFERFLD